MPPSCCAPRHCHYHLITRFGWLGLTVQVLFALEKQDLDTLDLDDFDDMDRAIRKDQQVAFDGQFYTRTMWYRTFTRSFPHLSVAWCYPGGLLLRRQKARQVPRRSLPPKLYMICAPIHPMRQQNATKQQNVTKFNKLCTSNLKTGHVDIMGYRMILWYIMDITRLYLTENLVPFHDLSLWVSKAIFGLPPMRRICELSTEDFEVRKLSLCRSDCLKKLWCRT